MSTIKLFIYLGKCGTFVLNYCIRKIYKRLFFVFEFVITNVIASERKFPNTIIKYVNVFYALFS